MTQKQVLPTVAIFDAFERFIAQRSGIDARDYASSWRDTDGIRALRADQRTIAKDGKRGRIALAQAKLLPFDAQAMADALKHSFSGRLEMHGVNELYYTAGQYFPTEYRKAAAVVLEAYIEAVRPKSVPQPGMRFTRLESLKRANQAAGGHWFDKDSMAFFNARLHGPKVYPCGEKVLFVASTRYDDDAPRRYQVMMFDTVTALVDNASDTREDYSTLDEAKCWAQDFSLGAR